MSTWIGRDPSAGTQDRRASAVQEGSDANCVGPKDPGEDPHRGVIRGLTLAAPSGHQVGPLRRLRVEIGHEDRARAEAALLRGTAAASAGSVSSSGPSWRNEVKDQRRLIAGDIGATR
jgi:hypothetical protein